jgi:hypothetical protein
LGLLLLLCLPRFAGAAPPGTILITPEQLELGGKDLDARVKKAAVKTVTKGEGGEWKFFLVAWLRKSPGSPQVALLFYDAADKAAKDPNNVIELGTQANAKILATSVSFGDDANLKPGHTYNIVIARKVGGKDEIYAKGQIELK